MNKTMDFKEAYQKMLEGKKVKNEFSNKHGYLYMFLDKEKASELEKELHTLIIKLAQIKQEVKGEMIIKSYT